jgi:hypothetical protein
MSDCRLVNASKDFFLSAMVNDDDRDAGLPKGNDVVLDVDEILLLSLAIGGLILLVFIEFSSVLEDFTAF